MKKVECWGMFELALETKYEGNPFTEVDFQAVFRHVDGYEIKAKGFYDGKDTFCVRCMPSTLGEWTYRTKSNIENLDGLTGSFACTDPSENNHGPVRVRDTFHFSYEDGTRYNPFGTTCYAWTHQGKDLQEQTLATLKDSPFNKIRMCVFPKHYLYNFNEPELYAFEGSLEKGWDFTRYNPAFFRHFEARLLDLQQLGIEADVILFHPYDRWGFSDMGKEADDGYLKYIVARISSFRNVWWSFANEYDFMNAKTTEDWERFAGIVMREDPYNHLRSIHNGNVFYDHTKPWITHCSIQRVDIYKTSENTDAWREQYQKPVVLDEIVYEGNIDQCWGNISGQELVRRFWEGVVRGGYPTHGETFLHSEDVIWWSHGGVLHGTSPKRIEFLKKVLDEAPDSLTPVKMDWDLVAGTVGNDYYLFYFGRTLPSFRNFYMPKGIQYKVEIIDTWEMTIITLPELFEGDFKIQLPAKEFIAVRMIKV